MENEGEYSQAEIDEAARAQRLVNEIIQRCVEAEIEYEDYCETEEFGGTDVNLNIYLPSGRKKREVNLYSVDDLEEFISIDFDQYIVVGNYAAICRYDNGIIETAFQVIDEARASMPFFRRRLLRKLGLNIDNENTIIPLELSSDIGGHKVKLILGPSSKELQVLASPPRGLGLSLLIHHPKFSTHADALRILEKFSHSLFFQIEAEANLGITLLRKRDRRFSFISHKDPINLEFPKYEYDDGPMALYWYARSARNMPLLQFLAFYQAIEFYFPAYFNAEVSRKMRTIIKDPSFRVDREADLARLVNTARSRTGGSGSEREQLRATLRECIDDDVIARFLEESKERPEFFASKQKGLTACTLNPKNKGTTLVDQVADRIYDIRCKVVHVKAEEGETELELLLPYTEESEKLGHDIELVRIVARKVLVTSSTPIRSS